ncbi:hypothetical protein [Rickettsia tamurae]|uniref:hypothetical protein n=1 Tax=Rickettsia tamurae TaxID=334545 RepID=UPI001BFD687F|nr:hypothetical protein [Rickettsia tamurae]
MRYLTELKRRNLKIMFYPMFFMDLSDKPWREHVTGSANAVSNFFIKRTVIIISSCTTHNLLKIMSMPL